jgi:hypothetical protein
VFTFSYCKANRADVARLKRNQQAMTGLRGESFHNETLSVAMRVCNEDCSPARIKL